MSGKLIEHKIIYIPYIFIFADCDIEEGDTEILNDYGEKYWEEPNTYLKIKKLLYEKIRFLLTMTN